MREAPKSHPGGGRVCPARHAGWLAWSARRLLQNPDKILEGLVRPGQTVADLGCGPGFFTLPMARLVGESGCVIAVDLQEGMLELLRARAAKAGLSARLRTHQCSPTDLLLTDTVSFALAFYMVHEVPDVPRFLEQVRGILAPGGRFLLVEPVLHVSPRVFAQTLELATGAGLQLVGHPRLRLSRAVLLERG